MRCGIPTVHVALKGLPWRATTTVSSCASALLTTARSPINRTNCGCCTPIRNACVTCICVYLKFGTIATGVRNFESIILNARPKQHIAPFVPSSLRFLSMNTSSNDTFASQWRFNGFFVAERLSQRSHLVTIIDPTVKWILVQIKSQQTKKWRKYFYSFLEREMRLKISGWTREIVLLSDVE